MQIKMTLILSDYLAENFKSFATAISQHFTNHATFVPAMVGMFDLKDIDQHVSQTLINLTPRDDNLEA